MPVVERDRQVHRSFGLLHGDRVGLHEGSGHVFGARRLVRPLDPRLGKFGGIGVVQVRIDDGHLAGLLAGGDDQRGVGAVGGHQAAHRVAGARGGVQVDQSGLTGRLGEAVGHRQRGGFLQGEHVGEVFGKVLQERLLG